MDGGYFTQDVSDELSIININSIYMNYMNEVELSTADNQLKWMEKVLQTQNKSFIISMHIPPALFFFKEVEDFWIAEYKETLLELLNKYQSKIVMILGAHIHQADIRAPISNKYPDLNIPLILTPSVSPYFDNNPGYTVLDLELDQKTKVWSSPLAHLRYFQLFEYTLSRSISFLTVDP